MSKAEDKKATPQNEIHCRGLKRAAKDLRIAANVPLFFGPYGPDWYQELSDRQMAAADTACVSVCEDMEQGTVHRCQCFLRGIGIKPIPKREDITLALRMSKGNDLAFLWFLLEVFYYSKDPTPTNAKNANAKHIYSVNERLLMSSIMHLDMVTTLRELHKMYPAVERPPKPAEPPQRRSRRFRYCSPYMEPLPRPVLPDSHTLPRPKLPGPNFEPYTVYLNPRHKSECDDKRWYAVNADGVASVSVEGRCQCSGPEYPDSREAIMDELFPEVGADGQGHQRDADFYDRLIGEFRAATTCYCGSNHPSIHDTPDRQPVHPTQFGAAASPAELRRLLANYKVQLLTVTLVKCLLFEPIPPLTNICVCINCPKCRADYDRLERLMKQNERRVYTPHPDDVRVRRYLFGRAGPVEMLRIFNLIAQYRFVTLDVCVKDVWQYELRLWTDVLPNDRPVFDHDHDGACCLCMGHAFPACGVKCIKPAPNDPQALDRELYDMLAQMRARDPRFVAACLPYAHRIPLLREWLAVRRGLVYTRAQRALKLKRSLLQWQFLERRRKLHIRVPEPRDVCRRSDGLHYGHKDDLMDCVSVAGIYTGFGGFEWR